MTLRTINNTAGQQSNVGGVNIGAAMVAVIVIVLLVCICMPVCVIILVIALACTCGKYKIYKNSTTQSQTAAALPGDNSAENLTPQPSASSHHLPLPPIPLAGHGAEEGTAEYELTYDVLNIHVEKNEAYCTSNMAPDLVMEPNKGYGLNIIGMKVENEAEPYEECVIVDTNQANEEVKTEYKVDKSDLKIYISDSKPSPKLNNDGRAEVPSIPMNENISYAVHVHNQQTEESDMYEL